MNTLVSSVFVFISLFSHGQSEGKITVLLDSINNLKLNSIVRTVDTLSIANKEFIAVKVNSNGISHITLFERYQDLIYDTYYNPTDIFSVKLDSIQYKLQGFIWNINNGVIQYKSIMSFNSNEDPLVKYIFWNNMCVCVVVYEVDNKGYKKRKYLLENPFFIESVDLNNLSLTSLCLTESTCSGTEFLESSDVLSDLLVNSINLIDPYK